MNLFSFLLPQNQQAPIPQMMDAGNVDPGRASFYQGNTLADIARHGFSSALKPQQPDLAQQALTQGAENGSVGPTVQNDALLQALQQQQKPSFLSGLQFDYNYPTNQNWAG